MITTRTTHAHKVMVARFQAVDGLLELRLSFEPNDDVDALGELCLPLDPFEDDRQRKVMLERIKRVSVLQSTNVATFSPEDCKLETRPELRRVRDFLHQEIPSLEEKETSDYLERIKRRAMPVGYCRRDSKPTPTLIRPEVFQQENKQDRPRIIPIPLGKISSK